MSFSLLILTQYFPPEVGAPQNRLFELAIRLKQKGAKVQVLTAMPNYPKMEVFKEYSGKKYCVEELEGIKVYRTYIYVSKQKGIIKRLLNYFSFVISSAWYGPSKIDKADFILCESPPLFLGYSAMYLTRKMKAKLIFNVSDLWPESAEKLGVVSNRQMLNLAYRLEGKLYKKSVLVTGQTQGICKDINKRFKDVKTYWLPNGVDLNYYNPDVIQDSGFRKKHNIANDTFLILYAGIIGLAQGLDVILQAALSMKDKNVVFVLLGNGPEKPRLMEMAQTEGLSNVIFIDSVSKKEMPSVLKASDASVIPLRKLELFKGAIPSKIFECLAMKLPIILGVDGEARELFIEKGKCGLYFEPENHIELCAQINLLLNDVELCRSLGENGRKYVNENFNRDKIAEGLFNEIKKIQTEKDF